MKNIFTEANKRIHTTYIAIITALIMTMVMAGIGVESGFDRRVNESREAYNEARAQYETECESLRQEQVYWQRIEGDYNAMAEELTAIYAERQAEIDAEAERVASLTPGEQAAEAAIREYNTMVNSLRASNPEYAELYVAYAGYISQDIFNLSKAELETYTALYMRKVEIESAYIAEHSN